MRGALPKASARAASCLGDLYTFPFRHMQHATAKIRFWFECSWHHGSMAGMCGRVSRVSPFSVPRYLSLAPTLNYSILSPSVRLQAFIFAPARHEIIATNMDKPLFIPGASFILVTRTRYRKRYAPSRMERKITYDSLPLFLAF